jgi:leucyl/phenylalanyl-tRNA--protein transferase
MPIFRLGREPVFPPVELAEPEGVLAIGGDLSVERLVVAYRSGIFPWYERGGPILWWSPDPRSVLFPDELRVTKRLARTIRSGRFEVRRDTAFERVIRACAEVVRPGEDGTWITPEMQAAYGRLHALGLAHSVETWREGRLVGGVYGVRMGRTFCGESMFHVETDASKVALAGLVDWMREAGMTLLDTQVANDHVLSMGAREIPRSEYLARLDAGCRKAEGGGP